MDKDDVSAHNIIQRYVTQDLSASEREEFEELMLEDEGLREELELELLMVEGFQAAKPQPAVTPTMTFSEPPWYRMAAAAAGVALCGSLLVNYTQFQARQQMSEPGSFHANVPMITLAPVRSANPAFVPAGELIFGANSSTAVLRIQLSFPEHETYDLRVLSYPDENQVALVTGLEPKGAGDLICTLPREVFKDGEYLADVISEGDSIVRIPFKVSTEP